MSGPTYEKRVERNARAIVRACDRMLGMSADTMIDAELAAVRELAKELLGSGSVAEVVELGATR